MLPRAASRTAGNASVEQARRRLVNEHQQVSLALPDPHMRMRGVTAIRATRSHAGVATVAAIAAVAATKVGAGIASASAMATASAIATTASVPAGHATGVDAYRSAIHRNGLQDLARS